MAESIDYNTDLEQLLKLHAEECESLSILHRNSYEKYNGRSNYINIPVIILSSAIGFATGIDIGYANMNIILGVSSIFVGIIKSIDTYFQLGKRAESHRLCSLQFQQINKKIQIELALVRSQRVDAKDMMNIIKTDIKNLFDIAPLIDQDVIGSFQNKYGKQIPGEPGKYKFDAHTPNLCNGLSIVTINSARNKKDYEERNSRKSSRDGSPSRDNNGNGGGVTVVIDDAAITQEISRPRLIPDRERLHQLMQHEHDEPSRQEQPLQPHNQNQMSQLHQQLQQLQQLQSIEDPIIIESIPDSSNIYHASADLVSFHSRASSVKAISPPQSVPRSVHRTAPPSVAPSVRQSAAPSTKQSAAPSVVPSTKQSAAPSVHQSAHQSIRGSAPPSVVPSTKQSAAASVAPSAPNSIHGESTPTIHLELQEPELININNTTHTLQLTQEQLQQLLQLQQQMMNDLEGEDGAMM